MTDKQPEALRLADWLEASFSDGDKQAAAELRRLHEVNAELVEALKLITPIECDMVHHAKKHQHSHEEECPVVAKVYAALAKATGENND